MRELQERRGKEVSAIELITLFGMEGGRGTRGMEKDNRVCVRGSARGVNEESRVV